MAIFRRLELIKSGRRAEVWRGVRTDNNEPVAIKYIWDDWDEPDDDTTDTILRFEREIRCLENLIHPNIVPLLGRRLSKSPYFYVMPLYKTSLYEQFPRIVGNTRRIDKIFGSVLKAIRYSHSKGVLHRDLKPENVLMNGDDDVVVSDFGRSREPRAVVHVDAAATRRRLPVSLFLSRPKSACRSTGETKW